MIFCERQSFTSRIGAQYGTTLLEMMLVLSIMGIVIVASLKAYQQFQNTLSLQQLQYNVDQLFEATANYYQANCATGVFSPNPPVFLSQYPVTSGTLTYPPTTPFPVYIATNPSSPTNTLLANGYLDNWHPNNPMVNPAGGESGYVIQLNPIVSTTSLPLNVCTGSTTSTGIPATPPYPCLAITSANAATPTKAYSAAPSAQIPTAQAKVVTWVIQVAVEITPQSKISGYGAALGATCISGLSGGIVAPCSAPDASHTYLVWTRIPSAISIKKSPLFASFKPLLKEFNLQYTHDQNYELNSGYSTSTTPSEAPVYYLCGG